MVGIVTPQTQFNFRFISVFRSVSPAITTKNEVSHLFIIGGFMSLVLMLHLSELKGEGEPGDRKGG